MQQKEKIFKIMLFGIILLGSALLTGCGPSQTETTEKKEYPIQTETIDKLQTNVSFSKPGKIVAAQDITVSSQANGRVSSISFKAGDIVKGGQPVVQLGDSIASYGLQVQRAKNGLESATLNYEQTKKSLEQQLSQAETSLKSAQNALLVAQENAENTMKQANFGVEKSKSQMETFKNQLGVQKSSALNLLDKIIYETDSLLGVTTNYKNKNDKFESYLGAKDQQAKINAESEVYTLYGLVQTITDIPASQDISTQQLQNGVQTLLGAYDEMMRSLEMTEKVLKTSVEGDEFPQKTINDNLTTFGGLKTSVQTADAGLETFSNTINAAVRDIEGQNVETATTDAELGRNAAQIAAQNAIFNTEVALQNAQLNYETIKANQGIQLKLLENAIAEARIGYESAYTQYNKLSVRAPIEGKIGSISATVGQDIGIGTPLFTMASNNNQDIEVSVTAQEYGLITIGDPVQIKYNDKLLSGKVVSLSPVAKNSLFTLKIQLGEKVDLYGETVTVTFPIDITGTLLPVNIITITSTNKGIIYLFNGKGATPYPVSIGKVRNGRTEILSEIPENAKIIISNIGTFNPNQYQMVEKVTLPKEEKAPIEENITIK